jgi:CubicO group peptidase (beta-lactamase class C family)
MMRVNRSAAFLVVTMAACCAALWWYATGEMRRKADDLMQLEISRGHFSGAVLISRDGKRVFEKAYGLANAEWKIPNATSTKFEIGSITKPFTAILIMQLEQEGKLALSNSVCMYLTNCPGQWQPITLHHLLSQTSGIFNLTSAPDFEIQRIAPQTHDEMVARFSGAPLAFTPPGSKFQYSNSNYYLLGMVIENITRTPYATVLRQRILEPLDMHDSGIVDRRALVSERASGYQDDDKGHMENDTRPMDPTWSFSAGAMYSTVQDLKKWSDALASGKLLPLKDLERMWRAVEGTYGYGWQIPTVDSGMLDRRVIEHGGRVPGFASFFSFLPDEHLTVIVLSNNIASNPLRIARGLSAIGLGVPYVSPLTREPAVVAPEILQRYAGEYQVEDKVWVVTARNGRLFARHEAFPEIEILPDSDKTFFFRDLEGTLKIIEEDGQVTGLLLSPSGLVAAKIRKPR